MSTTDSSAQTKAEFFLKEIASKLPARKSEETMVDRFSVLVSNMERNKLREEIENDLEKYYEYFLQQSLSKARTGSQKQSSTLTTARSVRGDRIVFPVTRASFLLGDLSISTMGKMATRQLLLPRLTNIVNDVQTLIPILLHFASLNIPRPSESFLLIEDATNKKLAAVLGYKVATACQADNSSVPSSSVIIPFIFGFASQFYSNSILETVALYCDKKAQKFWFCVAYVSIWFLEQQVHSATSVEAVCSLLRQLLLRCPQIDTSGRRYMSGLDGEHILLVLLLVSAVCAEKPSSKASKLLMDAVLHRAGALKSRVRGEGGWVDDVLDLLQMQSDVKTPSSSFKDFQVWFRQSPSRSAAVRNYFMSIVQSEVDSCVNGGGGAGEGDDEESQESDSQNVKSVDDSDSYSEDEEGVGGGFDIDYKGNASVLDSLAPVPVPSGDDAEDDEDTENDSENSGDDEENGDDDDDDEVAPVVEKKKGSKRKSNAEEEEVVVAPKKTRRSTRR